MKQLAIDNCTSEGEHQIFLHFGEGSSSTTAEDNSNKENPAGILTVYPLWLASGHAYQNTSSRAALALLAGADQSSPFHLFGH